MSWLRKTGDSLLMGSGRSGFLRGRLAHSLSAAYATGLLTQDTFLHRIDRVYGPNHVEPQELVGDLTFRRRATARRARAAVTSLFHGQGTGRRAQVPILALDWNGSTSRMLIGRSSSCDLVLSDQTVSRSHAELFFRDGSWILIDRHSTNGTYLNGKRVRRAELFPGDLMSLGYEQLRVD